MGRGIETINVSDQRKKFMHHCSGCGALGTNRRFCNTCATAEQRARAAKEAAVGLEATRIVDVIADDFVPTPRDPLRQVWAFVDRARQVPGVKAVSIGDKLVVHVWTRQNPVGERALDKLAKLCDVDVTIQRLEVDA